MKTALKMNLLFIKLIAEKFLNAGNFFFFNSKRQGKFVIVCSRSPKTSHCTLQSRALDLKEMYQKG